MPGLMPAAASPRTPTADPDAADGWSPVPLLGDARRELASCRPALERLAHALGGDAKWFHQHAWPCLLQWEAQVAGLPAAAGCLEAEVDGSALPATALALVLGQAARAAEGPGQCTPAARLALAQRAAQAQARRCAGSLILVDADGRRWQSDHRDCRRWRQTAAAPLRWRPLASRDACRALAAAVAGLGTRGVWHDGTRDGRWLASRQGWTLLWPLAGRDLQREMQDAGGNGGPDRRIEGALAPGLEAVRALLAQAGWLPAAPGPLRAQRSDGRLLQVLPVRAALRRACGLPAALPACLQVVLLAPGAPAASGSVPVGPS